MAGGEGEGFEELGAVRGVGGGRAALVVQAAHRREVLAVLKHLKRRLRRQLRSLHAMRRVWAAPLCACRPLAAVQWSGQRVRCAVAPHHV